MKPQGWSLRKTTGDVYPLPDSSTLQRWVVEGRVTRDDEVAEPGQPWVKAGSLKALEPFFAIVEQARRGKAPLIPMDAPRPGPGREGRTQTGELVMGSPVSPETPSADTWDVSRPGPVNAPEPAWASGPATVPTQTVRQAPVAPEKRGQGAVRGTKPERSRWPFLVLLFALLVVLGLGAGVAIFLFQPDWVPPEFSSLVKEWSAWAGVDQKETPRLLAPAAPGSQPAPPRSDSPQTPAPTPPPPPHAAAPAPAPAPPQAAAPAPAPAPAPPQAAAPAPAPAPPQAAAPAAPAPEPPPPAPPPAQAEPAPGSRPPAPTASAPPSAPEPADSSTPPPAPPSEEAESPPDTTAERRTAPPPPAAPRPQKPAVEKSPRRAQALLAQARTLRDRGRANQALDVYSRALQLDGKNPDALAGRGLAYLDLSRYVQAEESFKDALAVNPTHAAALMGLAETYRYEGKRSDAVTYYQKYLAAHPKGEEAIAARKAVQALEESP